MPEKKRPDDLDLPTDIYARKSTEQDADPEAKSVALQVNAARGFITEKGWPLARHEDIDDAVSGAETQRLKARQRLIDRGGRRRVVMRDMSRFSRSDGEDCIAELKALSESGAEIWFYQENVCFKHGTFSDNVINFVRAEMNAEYRRQIARDVRAAMTKRAQAGWLTTRPCFGYDAVRVGQHTERRVNEAQAEWVRRIFHLRAKGMGFTSIAHQLTLDGAPTPRPWRAGYATGWTNVGVREVLFREVYRGVVEWNKTRMTIVNGRALQVDRPRHEWMRVSLPSARIISEKEWNAAHKSMAATRASFQNGLKSAGAPRGPRRDRPSKYLLPGFAQCGICGGGIHVRMRKRATHGKMALLPEPTAYYACTTHYRTGSTGNGNPRQNGQTEAAYHCPHVDLWPMDKVNDAIVGQMTKDFLAPAQVSKVIAAARKQHTRSTKGVDIKPLQREEADLTRQRTRLVDAIAATAATLEVLLERLRAVENRLAEIRDVLGSQAKAGPTWPEIEAKILQRVADYRRILTLDTATARAMFSQLLATPITLTPITDDKGFRAVRYEAKVGPEAIFGEVTNGAFLSQAAPNYLILSGVWRSPRRAA